MTEAEIKVGGDIDSWCSRCKLELNHTITAITAGKVKKVKCNTCQFDHVMRKKPATRTTRKTKTSKTDATAVAASEFLRLLGKRDLATASSYKLENAYEQGDLIQHDGFGIGIVTDIKQDNKMIVMFKDKLRTMVYNWQR